MFILNGRCGNDCNIGMFTFRNISVIDYTLCSAGFLENVSNFDVIELDPLFSDGHSLLSVDISLSQPVIRNLQTDAPDKARPPRWKDNLKLEFKHNIDPAKLNSIKDLLNEQINDTCIKPFLNNITSRISDLFTECARKTFPSNPKTSARKENAPIPHKPWFGPQCNRARNSYNYARKAYQIHKCEVNKRRLKTASAHYKKLSTHSSVSISILPKKSYGLCPQLSRKIIGNS